MFKQILALSAISIVSLPAIVHANMVVTTKDGKQYTIPVQGSEIESIRFTNSSQNQSINGWTGKWSTSEGEMDLVQRGNGVQGTYSQDNGRISGTVSRNTLTGFWGEDSSARRCSTQRLNTFHWGKIVYTLDASGQNFTGKWGYCDDNPTINWTGKRK